MTNFQLRLGRWKAEVPRQSLAPLFQHRPELLNAGEYSVQTPVPEAIFRDFVRFLATGEKLVVGKENARFLLCLAGEFWIEDLRSESERFALGVLWESTSSLNERVCALEGQSGSRTSGTLVEDRLLLHEEELIVLSSELAELKSQISELSDRFRGHLDIGEENPKLERRLRMVTIDQFELEGPFERGRYRYVGQEKGGGERFSSSNSIMSSLLRAVLQCNRNLTFRVSQR
jgi:hypothetical protein